MIGINLVGRIHGLLAVNVGDVTLSNLMLGDQINAVTLVPLGS